MKSELQRVARQVADRLRGGGGLTVLTGAGISAESGVATFRDLGGLWDQYRVEDLASPEAFQRDPQRVHAFYNLRRAQLKTIEPNPGHRALHALEQHYLQRFSLITQNVDDLHERAGSRRLLHMHGELRKARCTSCGTVSRWLEDLDARCACVACGERALRPHIVWFGEMPLHMDAEIPDRLNAAVFLSIGTSGHVYPAAGFVALARQHGAMTVEINLEPSANADTFDARLYGQAGVLLPKLVTLIREHPA